MRTWIKALLIFLGIEMVPIIINGIINNEGQLPTGISFIIILSLSIAELIIYFIPTFIAEDKNHRNKGAIGLLNFFVGWTFIGG